MNIDPGNPDTLEQLDDGEVEGMIMMLQDLQRTRALARNDINALVAMGFEKGFTATDVKPPVLRGGLLIAFGCRLDKSGTNHTCSFLHVGEHWVWDSPDKVYDEIKNVVGAKPLMRSVTVLTAYEGMEVELISSRTQGGIHTMTKTLSFVVRGGELVATTTRAGVARGSMGRN